MRKLKIILIHLNTEREREENCQNDIKANTLHPCIQTILPNSNPASFITMIIIKSSSIN